MILSIVSVQVKRDGDSEAFRFHRRKRIQLRKARMLARNVPAASGSDPRRRRGGCALFGRNRPGAEWSIDPKHHVTGAQSIRDVIIGLFAEDMRRDSRYVRRNLHGEMPGVRHQLRVGPASWRRIYAIGFVVSETAIAFDSGRGLSESHLHQAGICIRFRER